MHHISSPASILHGTLGTSTLPSHSSCSWGWRLYVFGSFSCDGVYQPSNTCICFTQCPYSLLWLQRQRLFLQDERFLPSTLTRMWIKLYILKHSLWRPSYNAKKKKGNISRMWSILIGVSWVLDWALRFNKVTGPRVYADCNCILHSLRPGVLHSAGGPCIALKAK